MTLSTLLRAVQPSPAVLATLAVSVALTSCQLPDQKTQAVASTNIDVRKALSVDESVHPAAPAPLKLPAQAAPLNDTARMLAGLPAEGRDYFDEIRGSASWASHKRKLDRLWADFDVRHEIPIRTWASSQISDLQASSTLFYPFSGPDFLFADAFFPRSDTIVLCGLESCEPLPQLTQLSGDDIHASLDGMTTAISTAMQFSFFITKDMRHDLANTRFKGVLPLILTFMARSGHRVDSVDLVRLDGNGQPVVVNSGGNAAGLLIRGTGPGGRAKRVFYFHQDLSDGALHSGGPFLRFVSSQGRPAVFVKSASYLMQTDGFHTVRNFLMTSCRGIVQDPSGISYRDLLASGADVRLYGNYQGTLDMFNSHQQPDLLAAYQQGQAQPLNFGIGYMFQPSHSSLIVVRPGHHVSAR